MPVYIPSSTQRLSIRTRGGWDHLQIRRAVRRTRACLEGRHAVPQVLRQITQDRCAPERPRGTKRKEKKSQRQCQHRQHVLSSLLNAVIILYLMTCPWNCPWQADTNAQERSSTYPAVRRQVTPGPPSFKAFTLRVLLDQKWVQGAEGSRLPCRRLKFSSQKQVYGLHGPPGKPQQLVTFFMHGFM